MTGNLGPGRWNDGWVPVLWLYGPPGVGKSSVAWLVRERLSAAGVRVGYVDVDQLGMCYPGNDVDPGRHLLKSRNLAAVGRNFAAAGARGVVVSGVINRAGMEETRRPRPSCGCAGRPASANRPPRTAFTGGS